MEVCAECGRASKIGGGSLDACNGCKERQYCSKACQKKHWRDHKVICRYPAEKMKEFMDSIPLDFASDANSMKELKKHL